MDNLKMHSMNKIDDNIKKISELFPNAITEVIKGYRADGSVIIGRGIDFDILRQELSDILVEGSEERYQFTWPDKKNSILLANVPIAKTLRPCRDRSIDFDTTDNIYIEGDNLDVLKLLQETYLKKIKMIYIDPPYNTGKDLVFNDSFIQSTYDYLTNSKQIDDQGNKLLLNLESNGRFHTDWLNMIYPRLKLAKDLLTDDGFIFISIGEEELKNLLKICDEIFGADNFRNIIIARRYDKNLNRQFMEQGLISMNVGIEYILIYSRSPDSKMSPVFKASSDERASTGYWKGFWNNADRPTMRYDLFGVTPEDGQWKWKKEVAFQAVANFIEYEQKYSSQMTIEQYWDKTGRNKKFIRRNAEGKGKNLGVEHWVPPSDGILRNSNWADLLVSRPIGLDIPFDSPKNIDLLCQLIKLSNLNNNDIVLDFFSGSASTAHAVIQSNAENGTSLRYIMVQLPEQINEKSEAYKAGFRNICDIGEERIRRAGKAILERQVGDTCKLDIGFRVLKVDSTNMQEVYYNPAKYKQDQLDLFADNIKPDRSPEDLLFQVMLDLGVLLSSKIKETIIAGKKVFNVAEGYLMACFDTDVTSEVITEIAEKQPYYAVFRDSSMASDSVATNFEQIFETYSPTTVRKVL
jgi:adenine-specific DNA-methyltransferase